MKKRKKSQKIDEKDWRLTSIRIPKEFEERIKADYIDKFAMKESFNVVLFKLASFGLEFFKVTKRLDLEVLEEIQ